MNNSAFRCNDDARFPSENEAYESVQISIALRRTVGLALATLSPPLKIAVESALEAQVNCERDARLRQTLIGILGGAERRQPEIGDDQYCAIQLAIVKAAERLN